MGIIPQLTVNSIIAGSIYSLVALGFNLVYGTTKFFNVGHGVMCAVGGYFVFFLLRTADLNIYLAIITSVLISGLVGYVLELLIYRPLRKKKASSMILLIASLGAFTAIQALLAILFTSQFQALSVFWGEQDIYQIGNASMTQIQLVMAISVLAIALFLVWMLKATRTGKAIRAISDDEEVSKIIGINTNRVIGWVFFISSAIAGYAGILVGFDTGIEPTMGLNLLLKGIIASIVGGVGNVFAGVLGAFFLGFAENFGIWKISGEWKDAIAFGILILFLIFRPRGLIPR